MTYLEKALENYKISLVKNYCPAKKFGTTAPHYSQETEMCDSEGRTFGCKNRLCGDCWNQEILTGGNSVKHEKV